MKIFIESSTSRLILKRYCFKAHTAFMLLSQTPANFLKKIFLPEMSFSDNLLKTCYFVRFTRVLTKENHLT